ncbi:hypothetical protein GHK86_06620 [Acidimicrobiaceae bacterium USS-CC1]|uniref:Uncharacterized protein n=1 Tax=Acidiferrimicrobium australe TaxID=2664430 RepID=A0ABW9QVI6_9ACTN|nr:hypothetical protein [Acidiferrimicrobium australe]
MRTVWAWHGMGSRSAEGGQPAVVACSPGGERRRLRRLATALVHDDEAAIEAAVLALSRSRRALAPVALVVGALMMLLAGLRAAFSGPRLFLVEVLPATWVWLGMLDLKLHVLRGREFRDWHGAPALVAMVLIVALTVAAYWLSTVFALALDSPDRRVPAAFSAARSHLRSAAVVGVLAGAVLAVAVVIAPRWGRVPFSVLLGAAVAVLMVSLVAFPARVVGLPARAPRRDKLLLAAVASVAGALVCSPAYALGRVGTVLLGSRHLVVLGVVLVAFGYLLEVGASCAVHTVKTSAKLLGGRSEPATRPGAGTGSWPGPEA